MWGDAAGKFVRGGVGARGGDFIVLLQRQNVVSHGPARCSPVVSDSLCCFSLPRVDTPDSSLSPEYTQRSSGHSVQGGDIHIHQVK